MPSLFGEKALGIVKRLNTFIYTEPVVGQLPVPVTVSEYLVEVWGFATGLAMRGLLKPGGGVHKYDKPTPVITLRMVNDVPSKMLVSF